MVPVPYALKYTTTLTGRTPKLVACEECGCEYVYMLEQTVQSESTSLLFLDNAGARDRSRTQAETSLQQSLDTGCAVVPCPGCGQVQKHMIPLARRARFRKVLLLGLILLAAGAFLSLPLGVYVLIDLSAPATSRGTVILGSIVAAALVTGLALLLGRSLVNAKYDPNAEPQESRRARGQEIAIGKDEFLKSVRTGR